MTLEAVKTFVKGALTTLVGKIKEWVESQGYLKQSNLADYAKSADVVSNETYNADKATFETKENAAATYQPKGDYPTKTEMGSAIDAAKEAIVGEDLKDSLDTLESIKTWKEQHGTEYTSLLAEVQKKANSADVYSKSETDEKIAEVVAGSVDLEPYAKTADVEKTYVKKTDKASAEADGLMSSEDFIKLAAFKAASNYVETAELTAFTADDWKEIMGEAA